MLPTTEAPMEFHFGAVLTCLSALLSRPFLQVGPSRVHCNQFGVLVGMTGVSRKTTAANAALEAVEQVAPLVVVRGVGSREGIMAALPRDGEPAVLRFSEFTGFLKKSASKATASLTELLLELYDRPRRIENRTISNPIVVQNPNAVLLSDSTESHLAATFASEAVGSGLLNRLSIWIGQRGKPLPFPDPPDAVALSRWVEGVQRHLAGADCAEPHPTPAAKAQWVGMYDEVIRLQEGPHGEIIARIGDRAWQVAMMYALLDGTEEVCPDHLEAGWIVARYLGECALRLGAQVGISEQAQLLDAVVDAVKRRGPLLGPGYLKRLLSGRQRSLLEKYGGAKRVLDRASADGLLEYDSGQWFVDEETSAA